MNPRASLSSELREPSGVIALPSAGSLTSSRGTGLALAAIGLAAAAFGLGLATEPARAWGNLLISNFYFMSVALGALFFLALGYLASAGWSVVLRRVPEAMTVYLPSAGVLMLAVFLGRHELYHWTHHDAMLHDPVLASKSTFLDPTFFLVRMILALGLWIAFAHWMRRISLEQDRIGAATDGLMSTHRRLVRCSALFVVTFALTFSLASFDWLMSLEPHWYSTIFAVYTFAGTFQGALAAILVAVLWLRRTPPFKQVIHTEHLHDLGKLLFAFSTFWAYIWLSQYLLIWYGNLPEEIPHYVARTGAAWLPLFMLNLVCNWVVPFLVLMSRAAKRRPTVLLGVALIVLAGRWLDLYLHVMPALHVDPGIGAIEIFLFTGCAVLFIVLGYRQLRAAPQVPRYDPLLKESLEYSS